MRIKSYKKHSLRSTSDLRTHCHQRYRKFIFLLLLVSNLFLSNLYGQSGNVGGDGRTFSQRKSAWLASIPAPSLDESFFDRKSYIWGWLENGDYSSPVHETVQEIIAWKKGIHAQKGLLAVMILKYGDKGNNLMSDSDEQDIRDQYEKWIAMGETFSSHNPNKQIFAMIGVYIYTKYYNPSLELPFYGHPQYLSPPFSASHENSWPSFSQNGNSYTFGGGPYPANRLARDWIDHEIENSYLPANNREFDSVNYGRAFAGALIALWGALDNNDPLKKRAKMTADLLLLDGIMDVGNSNSAGGAIGRSQYNYMGHTQIFPTYIYWGVGEDNFRHDLQALWAINYEPPVPIIDAGVLTDETDSYYHWHKEYNNNSVIHKPDRGKWNLVTKYYNIGSSDGHKNQGWCVVIKGKKDRFIRFWINENAEEPTEKQSGYLGNNGRQFKNALFAEVGNRPYYWEKGSASWDYESNESGWHLKKLGKAMVAIKLGSTTAAVEVAIEGVDYKNWGDFKLAVMQNAELTSQHYVTSKNVTINRSDYCGLNQPGDCIFPFKRMETADDRGNKIVNWKNNIMTVSRHGRSVTYNFNNWTYQIDGNPVDTASPAAPREVSATKPKN